MRRFLIVSLVAVMVLTLAGAAWAAGGRPETIPGAAKERVQQFQQAMSQVKNNLQAMNQNRIRIREMRGEINGLTKQIRLEIQRIRGAESSMTEEQLEEIKSVIAEMRGFGKAISETMGQINEQAALMREARAELESGSVISAYTRIQAVQEARLGHLESLAAAMEAVLGQLQDIE
jgi:methyl-accepting chemotaxis protein